ncbi:MAG: hypothetical protein E6Q96_02460 [Cyclobacteriaceae bacterium]|nr:MAG: hypothetical protein E6Q96_02460 [Cyclobacteriaceae bacterium]
MKKIIVLIFCALALTATAQKTTFDIATYTVAEGWTPELKDFAASYVKTNNITRSWCRVTIYKSIQSSGHSLTDFNNEWNALIVKSNWGPPTPPQPETETEDGWTSHSAASSFTYENKPAYSLLSTITGYGVELSVVVIMNNTEFMKEIEQLLLSLDLKKPDRPIVNTQQSQPSTQPNVQNSFTVTAASGNHGIFTATTNFDDGWIAQPFADYVRVQKSQFTVLLHYGIEITDEMRATNQLEAVIFDRFILPRYNVSNIRKFDNGGPCYLCVHFFEADAVEKATGKRYHLGFRIITNNGISKCIEILSPSQAAFQQEFPNPEKVEALLNYNKFAVTVNDLAGDWTSSSGSYVNMYSTVTGSYAGMNASSSADEFTFNTNGTYKSNHKGAYGMVGSMNFYDQKYNGELTVSPWEITMTKRFDGKTSVFWAQYEAVRGGRVLHLTDKQYTGSQFHLGRKN